MSAIQYVLKRYKKSRTLRIKVKHNGEVLVTAPYVLNKKFIEDFVQKKAIWIQEKIDEFASLPQPDIKTQRGDYKKYKEQARKIVLKKIEKINSYYKFDFGRVAIRNQKTRWGSCSNKKNLNFNYKLALIPDKFVEYIVIHELCHLKEMNHGEKFWDLVAQTMPNYKKIRKELSQFKIQKINS